FSAKPVGINKVNLIDDAQVYPNPYSSTFTLKFDNPEEVFTIDVFNMIGKKVESFDCQSGPNTVTTGAFYIREYMYYVLTIKKVLKPLKLFSNNFIWSLHGSYGSP
ncbi:MAG: T9SS type A sorting domain-containing protein, partial [Salinivirgaceae bacterium]|nr:T9SS type A sorting domain-containing protein [Salinivirgaceae bacterium]